jgi:undecaprenyl-diphosphatase
MPSCAGGEDAASWRAMRPAERALSLRHAVALGLLQGPTELLPVSSSAHTALVPWLAGWSYAQLDGELRKSFEVALHAGAGLALTLDMRGELLRGAARLDRRRATVLALSLAPPVVAGFALRAPIERLFGGPRSAACGLALGAVAMAAADRRAGRRGCDQAGAADGLALGLAQASALMPGVSRNGATLTVARARGFERGAADRLSWAVALPVILGASVLKGARLRRDDAARGARVGLAAGAISAFASTLMSARLLRGRGRERALWPCALYRCVLAGVVMMRVRGAQ